MPLLERYGNRPVLEPDPRGWDCVSVFNPGAIEVDGEIHMLYRAVSDLGEYISRFGLAVSTDGREFHRTGDEFVFGPREDFEVGGVEDARIVPDPASDPAAPEYLVTYAAVSVVPGPVYEAMDFFRKTRIDPFTERPGIPPFGPTFTGLLRTRDFRDFRFEGLITPPNVDDRDGVLFPEKIDGRYALLHRPSTWTGEEYGTDRAGIWLAFSDDLKTWDYGTGEENLLLRPDPALRWEEAKIGAGPPPIRTDAGWLMIYHGVDHKYVYRVGAALLDLRDPGKVLARTRDFLMEPVLEWERVGVIPNVVFPTANILRGDELLVYYGGADRVVGLAIADVNELIDHLS